MSSMPVGVEVLICGSPDRADDRAALAAATFLRAELPPDVALRIVGQLDVDDLLGVPAGSAVVIVDAATGLRPGQVVDLPFDWLGREQGTVRPESSHGLPIPDVLGLAELIQGRPMRGRLVAIGALDFGLGRDLSAGVRAAIPSLVEAVREAVEELRMTQPAGKQA